MLKVEKEQIITRIILSNIEKFAIELGYSYLNGGYDKWEDGKGEIHKISSMEKDYLENCIHFVERGLDEIDTQSFTDEIREHFKKFVRKHDKDKLLKHKKLKLTESILKEIKKELKQTLKYKKDELKKYY